jgi:hypothetical protein
MRLESNENYGSKNRNLDLINKKCDQDAKQENVGIESALKRHQEDGFRTNGIP